MAKLLLVVLFLLVASPVLAAEVLTDSGLKIQIPDSEIAFYQDNGLVARFPSGLFWWIQTIVHVPVAQGAELTLEQQIKLYIITTAQHYKTDSDFMLQLAGCESGFQPDVYNDHEPIGGTSWGLYQWQVGSWNFYNKAFKTNLDRKNWQDQVEITAKVLKKYGSGDWRACTKYIKRGDNFIK